MELGIIGFFVTLLPVAVMILEAVRNTKCADLNGRMLRITFFSIIILILIEWFILQIQEYIPVMAFFWIALAYLVQTSDF